MRRVIRTITFIVTVTGYLIIFLPRRIEYEKDGVPRDAVILRYDPSKSGRYVYPIVGADRDGTPVELTSELLWWFKWQKVGAHVPILDLGNQRALIGSPLSRWSDMIFIICAGILASVLSSKKRLRPPPVG